MSTKRKTSTFFSLVLVAAVTSVPAAFAGFSQGTFVTLGGQPAFQILGDAEGFTAERRAWHAQDALDNALVLSSNLSPSAVEVGRMNGAIVVMLDGRKVATADANSALLSGMSPRQLAESWADSIRAFLSNREQTLAYVDTLKDPHRLEGNVAYLERRLYAPAGTRFAVALRQPLTMATLQPGVTVEGVIEHAVVMGDYAIPQGTLASGQVVAIGPDLFGLRFTSLRTPSGTLVPITATVVTEHAATVSTGPYLVSTYSIPAASTLGMPLPGRKPANVGLGVVCGAEAKPLVLHRGSALTISQPLTVLLEETTPVAVVSVGHSM